MMALSRLSLYFHTLRHLKPVQIWGRLAFKMRAPAPDPAAAPPVRAGAAAWCRPVRRNQSLLGECRFKFLNVERDIASAEDWNAGAAEKLWLYNLHYFDDLNAIASEERCHWHKDLMGRWLRENPPGVGPGWEPYPISLRVVNWIKWCLGGNEPSEETRHSLAVQVRFLYHRMEFHLLGNHLLVNAKALLFAGLYFEGEEAERWYRRGRKVFADQLEEQVLADGGHFERSPMYHALTLEDVLDVINVHRAYGRPVDASWGPRASRMIRWLAVMSHPDGDIAFFNDAAFGTAPSLGDLVEYAQAIDPAIALPAPPGSVLLPESGFGRIEGSEAVILADVGSVGPSYQPGHAHAGTLSFELSLFGRRVLVNSGTSVYGTGEERDRQRGTAAHNTVRVDRCDSSEVWSGFRVARRARAFAVQFAVKTLSAAHDGYRRLSGRPMHHRRWILEEGHVEIADELRGDGSHLCETFFHIHPDWSPEIKSDGSCELVSADGGYRILVQLDPALTWNLETATWHPQFGVTARNHRLTGSRLVGLPTGFTTRLSWSCESSS